MNPKELLSGNPTWQCCRKWSLDCLPIFGQKCRGQESLKSRRTNASHTYSFDGFYTEYQEEAKNDLNAIIE